MAAAAVPAITSAFQATGMRQGEIKRTTEKAFLKFTQHFC